MITEFIDLLKSLPNSPYASIQLAGSVAALAEMREIPPFPAAFVIPVKEEAAPNALDAGAVRQTTGIMVSVVTACAIEDFDSIRENFLLPGVVGKVIAAAKNVDIIQHLKGDILDISATQTFWQDVFVYYVARRYN